MSFNLNTKSDFQDLLQGLLQPLKGSYSGSGALLDLGRTSAHYPDRVAMLEGFARVLWGLVPFWKGGGDDQGFLELYQKGLAAGTDPAHPDYWDAAGEVNQRYVEMAAISLGLLLVPEMLWAPLSPYEKERLSRWLYKINTIEPASYPDCNWWFFVVLTNLALKQLGLSHSSPLMETALRRIESFYLGEGWYKDGTSGRKDYYVSFAIHFYSLIYTTFMQEEDPERCRMFRERADRFALDFLYWFDEKGRAVPYGRSLTYRFAQGAFWSAYLYAGGKAVSLGVIKGILVRHLQDWLEWPIRDRDGILTIGYRYPCLNMAENYNAPGSPYWALKVFLILALPDAHPFWKGGAEPMPLLEPLKAFHHGEILIQQSRGHTVLYPSALFRNDSLGHLPEKYGKFAYSTEFGFSVAVGDGDLGLAAPDSMLAFELDGYFFVRRNAMNAEVEEKQIRSVWSPVQGITVETVIIPTKKGHIRRHKVVNEIAPCRAFDCGFAVHAPSPVGYDSIIEKDRAAAACDGASCSVAVLGYKGYPQMIAAAPNTNLIHSKTVIPCICYEITNGTTILETEVITEVIK